MSLRVLQQTLAHLLSTLDLFATYESGWDGDSAPFKPVFLLYTRDVIRSFVAALSWRGIRPLFITIAPEDDSCISLFCGYGDRAVEVFVFGEDPDLAVFLTSFSQSIGPLHFTPQLFSGKVFDREMDWLGGK